MYKYSRYHLEFTSNLHLPKCSLKILLVQGADIIVQYRGHLNKEYKILKCMWLLNLNQDLTQGTSHFWKLLRHASANSKFVVGCIKGNFVSDYVFNLHQKTSSPSEMKVLEKGLGFSPSHSSVNEADLPRNISDFTRKTRCKWFFGYKGRGMSVKHPSLRVRLPGILQRGFIFLFIYLLNLTLVY